LHKRGDGSPYYRPKVEERKSPPPEELYVGLPAELWGKGWMAVLSGAALATLVILLDDSSGRPGIEGTTLEGRGGREYLQVTDSGWQWIAETVLAGRNSQDLWTESWGAAAFQLQRRLDTSFP
ncbi:MAG: hypothetical protein ACRDPR_11115, partial [Nocardioidaceae bacterium]